MPVRMWFQDKKWTQLLICLWEIFSLAAVSRASSKEEALIGAVGESLTFPTLVPVADAITYKGLNIGLVVNKQAETEAHEKFKNRLHWDSQSGFFTLSDLRTDDSGVYKVISTKEQTKTQVYELNVYDNVSAPQVVKLKYNPSESDLCLLLCSVRNARGLNLTWFKGNVKLKHTSSSSLNDTLYLPLRLQQSDNDTYDCVASNPASKQMIAASFMKHCFHHPERTSDNVLIISITCAAVAVMGTAAFLWRKKFTCLPEMEQQNDPELLTEVIYMTASLY